MVEGESSPGTGPLVVGRRVVMKTAAWSPPVIAVATFGAHIGDAIDPAHGDGATFTDAGHH